MLLTTEEKRLIRAVIAQFKHMPFLFKKEVTHETMLLFRDELQKMIREQLVQAELLELKLDQIELKRLEYFFEPKKLSPGIIAWCDLSNAIYEHYHKDDDSDTSSSPKKRVGFKSGNVQAYYIDAPPAISLTDTGSFGNIPVKSSGRGRGKQLIDWSKIQTSRPIQHEAKKSVQEELRMASKNLATLKEQLRLLKLKAWNLEQARIQKSNLEQVRLFLRC